MKKFLKNIIYRILRKIYNFRPEIYLNISKLIQSVQIINIKSKKGREFYFNVFNNYDYSFFYNFYSKEKDTSEWILNMPRGSVFFDIGANVGTYTIMAAMHCDNVKVISFEPVAKNYYALIKNISNLKPVDICAYCLSLTNQSNFKYLNQWGAAFGGSEYLTINKRIDDPVENDLYFHGSINVTLDSFIESTNIFPTHLKVDIDGNEKQLLEGAENTLKNKKLRSIIIEISDFKENDTIKNYIEEFGFKGKISNNRNGNHIFERID